MAVKETSCASFCSTGIAEGCKTCVQGKKLVLFISGICHRNCFYCSLSEKRKNVDRIWANERPCKDVSDMIKEVKESNATGAGITGGDPLLCIERTLEFANALKKNFGRHFHIHIYLPTKLVSEENLRKLSKCIDEVRFHPEFLARKLDEKEIDNELKKISIAGKFFERKNIGIELPCLPGKEKEIFSFIKKAKNIIGFVNLNELEIGETNLEEMIKSYELKEGGYVIAESKESGLRILEWCEKEKLGLNVHLCTAETKNCYQFRNRLKMHKILPYGYQTDEGTVRYFVVYYIEKNIGNLEKFKEYFIDRENDRLILSEKLANKILGRISGVEVALVEEYPTFGNERLYFEKMKRK